MDNTKIDICRQALKRIAWRLQYRERKRKAEITFNPDFIQLQTDPFNHFHLRLYALEQLHLLPSTFERFILYRLFLDEATEKQVAQELQISQQAVSKWKKKSLKYLSSLIHSTPF